MDPARQLNPIIPPEKKNFRYRELNPGHLGESQVS
jgi:hypothetical protein